MRLLNGVFGAAVTLGVLATGMYTVNFTARSWAARRLSEHDHDLNAEAVLLGF